MRATITIYPRADILDPQGKAICQALGRVGFDEVEEVRAGKSFEIELGIDDAAQAKERLEQMCETLLANTVIEDYSVHLLEDALA